MARAVMLDGIRDAATEVSRLLGHDLGPWERANTKFEALAVCSHCGFYAVVQTLNTVHEESPYGSAVQVKCQGRDTIPLWAPQKETQSAA